MDYGRAITKFVRISPKKARLAADLIRGMPVEQATLQLGYSNLKGGRLLKKTLDSAVASAELEHGLRKEKLKVIEVKVDDGPRWKRAKARNRGGRSPILKRTSHFTVVVGGE